MGILVHHFSPLPKILPVNEVKNTANIIKTCKESTVPIVITKNIYEESVLMSIELYEEMFAKIQAVSLINASIDDLENNSSLINGKEFFNSMRKKYNK